MGYGTGSTRERQAVMRKLLTILNAILSEPILMSLSMEEDSMGADYQQFSEISVSHF
jgi:hypothetical protein